jgi:integrase/recombinase XerD
MAVTLYRQVGRGEARRYTKVNLGPGRRPIDLAGPYFLRYSLPNGTRPWEPVGGDLEAAIDAQKQKQAYFDALDAGVPIAAEREESSRMKIADAVSQWLAELRIFQGKDQQGKSEKTLRAYNYRLGFFLDFTAQQNLRFLDEIDRRQLLRYVKFLRDHDSDFDDRTVHNIFETLNTWLRTRDIFIAGKILAELDYAEKPPKPYTKDELDALFAAMDDEEKLLYGLILNSGVRDAEMQNTEYADFNWGKYTLHVQPKPWRNFRLKGKKKKKSAKDRFVPIPAKLVRKIKERMEQRNAQPHDLVFPNSKSKPDGHFLRKLKVVAMRASVEDAELHRFRKTYADTLHEEGVSVNTIRKRLGHESLDVTLRYLKGKDAESEEAQEYANSSSLALYI